MTFLTLRDAGGSIRQILAQIYSGSTYLFGNFHAAVIEGGASQYINLDVDEVGANIKASAGQVYAISISNSAISAGSDTGDRYVKLYDKASAATSSDTPKWVMRLGPGQSRDIAFPTGLAFPAGISIRATKGRANNDNFAPADGEVTSSIAYA